MKKLKPFYKYKTMFFYLFFFQIKEMMEQAGNSHLLTVLSYPNAGHLIEPPYTPHARATLFRNLATQEKGRFNQRLEIKIMISDLGSDCRFCLLFFFAVMVLWGGETVAHSHAQEDAWRKLLVFLKENLYSGTNSGATLLSHL